MSIVREHPVKALPFTKTFGFRKALNHRVEDYFKQTGRPQRDVPEMYAKTFVLLAVWAAVYALILFVQVNWLLTLVFYAGLGFVAAGIGFNVMHDAIHGGYSNNPRINKLMGYTMDFIGSSSFIWKQRHNVWHHTYTNIAGLDEDLETRGTMRFSPHDPWRPVYRYQHWYVSFIYGLIGFAFQLREFQVFFVGRSSEFHVYPKMHRNDKIVFWVGKLVFFALNLFIPMLVMPWWLAVAGWFVLMFAMSFTSGYIFQIAHVMEQAKFPEPVGDPLHVENEWAVHQVETTVDFAPGNKFLNWYSGGLNFQIEHHLFPHICHVHYPQLAPIVKQTCEEFGVKYYTYPTWRAAVASHYAMLKELGKKPVPAAVTAMPTAAR